jgi:hypothetical protein
VYLGSYAPAPTPQTCAQGAYDQNGNWVPNPNCYSNQQQYPPQPPQQNYNYNQQQYPPQQQPYYDPNQQQYPQPQQNYDPNQAQPYSR